MTDGAWIESFCEWSMWPLCSSTRATPLKIMTTARLSVHTLMGSKEVLSTKTLPFILGLILRERGRQCQNMFRRGPLKLCFFAPLREIFSRTGSGQGQDKHTPCPSGGQRFRTRGDGGAGREYIVNQKNILILHQTWVT